MQEIELIIFDCDGVLIDSEVISARMLVSELAERGVKITLEYIAKHFLGRSYSVVLAQIREEFGVDLPPEFEADYRRRLLATFETDLKIMPGVRDVLAQLRSPYCLATSSSAPRMKRSLEIVGLADIFAQKTTTASEVAQGKPAPDLFLRAAEKMGTPPDKCLVIEDSNNGVRAGLAAGMEVWRFTGGSHLKNLKPDNQIEPSAHQTIASFSNFFQLRPELKIGENKQ